MSSPKEKKPKEEIFLKHNGELANVLYPVIPNMEEPMYRLPNMNNGTLSNVIC